MSADKKDRSRNVTKRHEFADYLNIQDTENPSFVLMGTGFTTLDENPGAQTSKKKYVNEAASSSSITSYETVFPFESDLIIQQEAVLALYSGFSARSWIISLMPCLAPALPRRFSKERRISVTIWRLSVSWPRVP